MGQPFISICIPAYKRLPFLKRLLDSIAKQNYAHFEVIISDDSDDDTVYDYLKSISPHFTVHYYKNSPSLGTPANWNFAISKANGEWIKLIHDDDWFTSKDSLQEFADATSQGRKFIYSAYSNYLESNKINQLVQHKKSAIKDVLKQPLLLLSENIIGPPSVTLFHNSIVEKYDERMKWRVDLEYYIRVLQQEKEIYHIPKPLIHVGVSESQVTNYCINIPSVEIPEGHILLTKYGTDPLKNINVFDAWWRILRNCGIHSNQDLTQFGNSNWPLCIHEMINLQSRFTKQQLKNGVFSKVLMTYSYIQNYFLGKL
jgi:glycosyltransferase involved in cell wall biosynthesis